MRVLIYISLLIALPQFLVAQAQEHCANHIILTLTSVNLAAGCDFDDGGGLDPSIVIYDLAGNQLINIEIENMNNVDGPGLEYGFNLSDNPNCCGDGYSETLGIFPIEDVLLFFDVEIFENDGACCNGYSTNDDSYATDIISINLIDEITGTIDVGSCVSFNYSLDITQIYEYGRMQLVETVCANYSVTINDLDYDINNPMGFDTIWGGAANGCDSFIYVELDFYELSDPEIVGNELICIDGTGLVGLTEEFTGYSWSTGETTQNIMVAADGFYVVTVETADGCFYQDVVLIEYFPEVFPEIIGSQEICVGLDVSLTVDGDFQSYAWSTGETDQEIVVVDPGEYVVSVVSDDGCVYEDVFDLLPVFLTGPIILGEPIFCFDESTVLEIEGLYFKYEWSNGETTSSIEVFESGLYVVTISDADGCEITNEIEVVEREEYIISETFYTCFEDEVVEIVEVIFSDNGCAGRSISSTLLYAPIPEYELIPTQVIVSGDTIALFVNLDIPEIAQVNWYGPDGLLICSDCPTIEVFPNTSSTYEVEIDFHPECQLRESVDVIVKSDTQIYIPNIFYPDSQQGNERFRIFGKDILSIEVFNIYDRWGNLVFESSGVDVEWDGRQAGLEIMTGVYVYHIELTFIDGTNKTLVGDITLLQ